MGSYGNLICRNAFAGAGPFSTDHDSGINGSLVFHTSSDNRRLRHHKRNCLLLHVRSHQRARVIIIFKERYHSGRNRNYHLRRYIHIINLGGINLNNLRTIPRSDLLINKMTVFVKRLVRLSNNIVVLGIGSHMINFKRNRSGGFIYLPVRSLNKSIFINARIGRKI